MSKPRLFKKTEEKQTKEELLAIKKKALDYKNRIGLVPAPEDLINGMSGFLQEVGYSNSFLDSQMNKKDLWQQVTRGMINNMSIESQIF